jgi:death on curing protein
VSWEFLDVPAVERLHRQQIVLYGGAHGLRDANLLASAVERAANKAHYEPESSLAVLAATLAWGLIKNHAFIDGNKRIGLVSLVVFVEGNGFDFTATDNEAERMVLKAAGGEIDEAAWTDWVRQKVTAR